MKTAIHAGVCIHAFMKTGMFMVGMKAFMKAIP